MIALKSQLILTASFILVVSSALGFVNMDDEIKAECGARARIVWCQDAGAGTDAGAQGNSLRLMGFDTDDGKGERTIMAGLSNYARPMLTPDGRKVVYSNRPEQKIYVVDFDGSGLKPLASGLALAVWRDHLTETEWVYAGEEINQADSVIVNVRRFRLDKPDVSEPVWSRTPLNIDNFQLSAAGRYACGTFPWPACGIAALPNGGWKKFGDGCWPSLSPDNSLLMWIFDGAHRNLTIFRAKTDERWLVNINNAPGIDGYEVYHPRWSTHPLFMVMTGPYKVGEGNNRIRGGGKGVEIYLGRFSADYRKIEKWIQVTHNQSADFFPDMWVAEGRDGSPSRPKHGCLGPTPPEQSSELRRLEEASLPGEIITGGKSKTENGAVTDAWPVSFDKIFFYWQNRSKANSFTEPGGDRLIVCRAEAKGRARYGRNFEMMPCGGAFIAAGGAGELIEKCAASRQLGIEALITPGDGNFERGRDGSCYSAKSAKAAFATKHEPNRPDSEDRMPRAYSAGAKLRAAKAGRGIPTWNSTGNTNLSPIVGYSAGSGKWNFLLGQKGARLIFQLRSARGGPDYLLDLGAIALDRSSHVIVSCSSSSAACYLNGEQIFSADSIYGGNWTSGRIVFGNELLPDYSVEPDGMNAGWKGRIENVAIHSRWIGLEEARKKYSSSIANITGDKQIPGLSVKATLISEPGVPAPASIAPYRRALIAGHYRILEVVEGKCADKEIMAAGWAILDGKVLKNRSNTGQGLQSLRLELFSDHPELEGERLIMDSEQYDLPLYYVIED